MAKPLTPEQIRAASRLQTVFAQKNWNQTEIAEKLGYERSIVNKYINAKQAVSESFLRKMEDLYHLSSRFILEGVGPTFLNRVKPGHTFYGGSFPLGESILAEKNPAVVARDEAKPIAVVNEGDVAFNWAGSEFRELSDGRVLMTIPLVDEFAQAGYLAGWKDPEFIEELPKHSIVVAKRHTGKYRAFEVVGDSMDSDRRDAICAGDIVVGRSIDKTLWNTKFHLHRFKDYLIVHQDGVIIKRITAHNVEEGIITCASTNPDKEAYPDFEVRLSEVYEIYNIVSVERKWKA
ncbi:LexA family transcriptional regulator [Rudanella paleaurantiibacter]|nr:LexA family transcriptional regulator [Rudanella paleaurantiibacter]